MAHVAPDGHWLRVNPHLCEMLGYTPDELKKLTFQHITHPEDVDEDVENLHRLLTGKSDAYSREKRYIRKDGSIVWAKLTVSLAREEGNVPVYFVGVVENITRRKCAEDALAKINEKLTQKAKDSSELLVKTEERLDLLVDSVEDYAIFMLDPNGKIQTWNRGAARIKGYDHDEIVGQHASVFYTPEDRAAHRPDRILAEARAKGRVEDEGWRVRKDGSKFWANVVITALYDHSGKLRGFCKVTRDLTERRAAEEARLKLEQEQIARAEADRINRIKDEFLAVVSHELRTPLTPILGWSRMLLGNEFSAEDRGRALKVIERNAEAQLKLIEELLDIGRIVAGKLHLDSRAVLLAPTVEAAADAIRPAAVAKEVALLVTIEDTIPPIFGDAQRLQQILWNLLTNAVKFTPRKGRIEIHVRRRGNFAQVEIQDTGEGISADYLPHVFERFSQYESGSARRHGGLGIGLYVVRQLTELHGGSVRVHSDGAGKGTTFTVDLPIPAESSGAASSGRIPVPPVAELNGLTVMVVDDERDAREFFAFALRKNGADVVVCSSAFEALERLSETKADVLISDIGMPGKDGFELIRNVRKQGYTLPAVAVSAYVRSEDSVRALTEGFQCHLGKPVNPEELCATVKRLCDASKAAKT